MSSGAYLPTPLQEYVHKSRYARWLDKEKRRETWPETIQRYTNYFADKYPQFPKDELQQAIQNQEVMPSMRALMTAGPALDRDPMAGYNPVAGDTRVVTREYGNVAIKELQGKAASVVNKNGEWASAQFNSYGLQPLKRVTLGLNSNTRREVFATANHRWVLSDGRVVSTEQLQAGDHIDFVTAPKAEEDADYSLGIRHGIVYGDGTVAKAQQRVKGYMVRLCGVGKAFLSHFAGYPVSYPPSANGDPIVMLYDDFAATHSLKELPSPEESEAYLLGFIRGWLSTDGSIAKRDSQVTLCCNQEGRDWLYQYAERAGFVLQGFSTQPRTTNFGDRKADSFVVRISRSSLTTEDVLSETKKQYLKPLASQFHVRSVESTDRVEEVFCAEVPDTNTFVLEGGLLTGNCTFVAIDDVRAFDEILYILMCGCGAGFSVERQFIAKLPVVAETFVSTNFTIQVRDSKAGWANAFRELLALLYYGTIPQWDTSLIRPEGARLKTFGGRASGPKPLEALFQFTVTLLRNAAGRKLTSIECHDLVCKVADIVVVGGVRRSALISLSNLSDDRMRNAKNGQWWVENPQRTLANNSAAYTERPQMDIFMKEWLSLIESKSGERGIFNRQAAVKKAVEIGRRDATKIIGVNPCAEIALRSSGVCNLSEVIIRAEDSLETLKEKVRKATIIGTFQSTLTNFRYVRAIWRQNQEEERLLGVSLTGIMDHPVLSNTSMDSVRWLQEMKQVAIDTNKEWAAKLGINPAGAITTVKPSGTVSQLVDSASGIHPRYAAYYTRTVRADKKDPLSQLMRKQGFPVEDCVSRPQSTDIFSFPVQCPAHAVQRNDRTAIEQLEHYLMFQTHWSEHNVSVTVYVKEHEWLAVGDWVYQHFDKLAGVSFLPHSDHIYPQAPYTECTPEAYTELASRMPQFDWQELALFEQDDATVNTKELACTAGVCDIL